MSQYRHPTSVDNKVPFIQSSCENNKHVDISNASNLSGP